MTITTSGTTITFNDSTTQNTAATGFGFKNRIINGAMIIDQRNSGASITPSTDGQYTLDRWFTQISPGSKFSVQQNAGAVTPPVDFSYYLGATSNSAYSVGASEFQVISQIIEGLNFSDMAWGTASAKTVTLSFWVRSSLTGTFGASFSNMAQNRSYPFTYTISAANTWEQKTVTVAGDTSGSWPTTSAGCLRLRFGLGVGSTYSGTAGSWSSSLFLSATGAVSVVGTNGATFYITGVQLEKGPTATAFDYRPSGTELQLCQRYYCQMYSDMQSAAAGSMLVRQRFPVPMRATPTFVTISGGTTSNCTVSTATGNARYDGAYFQISASAGSGYVLDYLYSASAEFL